MPTPTTPRRGHLGCPTRLRELLGDQSRGLRQTTGVSRVAAGFHIGASASTISRIELGRVRVKEDDLHRLLQLYGVSDEHERRSIRDLMCRANNRQWWHDYSDVLPAWFCSYLALESGATTIRTYQTQFIPGLLQTPEYAEAVIRLRFGGRDVARRVGVRMRRQRILHDPHGPDLWAVIDEAALRRPVGSASVMRTQLARLIRGSTMPNVHIQVLPLRAGGQANPGNSFTILRLPITSLLDVVYLEQINSALYFSDDNDCEPYKSAMQGLCATAQPPADTIPILTRLLERQACDQRPPRLDDDRRVLLRPTPSPTPRCSS